MVLDRPSLISDLIGCLFEEGANVRLRAADALEKVSRTRPALLQKFVVLLLCLLEEAAQPELRWHLAVILPRLRLNGEERQRTVRALQGCLTAESSLVKTFALQGLADVAVQDSAVVPFVLDSLKAAERAGTPAMKARSRKLLRELERRTTKR